MIPDTEYGLPAYSFPLSVDTASESELSEYHFHWFNYFLWRIRITPVITVHDKHSSLEGMGSQPDVLRLSWDKANP